MVLNGLTVELEGELFCLPYSLLLTIVEWTVSLYGDYEQQDEPRRKTHQLWEGANVAIVEKQTFRRQEAACGLGFGRILEEEQNSTQHKHKNR